MVHYHLPGLFEFFSFYKDFLPLFHTHRNWFYDWCEIGSIYGAPGDCLWGGGRVGYGDNVPKEVAALLSKYGISARLTFSNSLLKEEHLADKKCNELCRIFSGRENGIIVSSDLLTDYIKNHYPGFYFVSSTTKVLTKIEELLGELEREDFLYVVPDFRFNNHWEALEKIPEKQRGKVEFLCNECCYTGCADRKKCYESVSRKALGEDCDDHICRAPGGERGYRFSAAKDSSAFISLEDILQKYVPAGFHEFKIEGRSLGSALLLEFILYYMTKPEYQLHVREEIYLDAMLDLY